MTLSSAEIKRQILESAGSSVIKRKIQQTTGTSDGDQIEWGNDLESVTKMRGWVLIESYMLRRMNLVGLVLSDDESPNSKGMARGFIELMQWIHLTIKKKDELLEKERLRHEAKNVPDDKED